MPNITKIFKRFKNVITLEHFQSGIKQLNTREKILKNIYFISSFILIKAIFQINFSLTKRKHYPKKLLNFKGIFESLHIC